MKCWLSSNGSTEKDIFCVWVIESNSLQADIGKLHIISLKLLVPIGKVILTVPCKSKLTCIQSLSSLNSRKDRGSRKDNQESSPRNPEFNELVA